MPINPFQHRQYLVRRRGVWPRARLEVHGPDERPVLYSRAQRPRIRRGLVLCADRAGRQPVLTIRLRQPLDFAAAYEVIDAPSGTKLGSVRRLGFRSLLRNDWAVLDAEGVQLGTVRERSIWRAVVRRFVSHLVSQHFTVHMEGLPVAALQQCANPVSRPVRADFSADDRGLLDRRLGVAIAVLLCAGEGRED